MFIKQIDRNSIQLHTSKDGHKHDLSGGKIQSTAQNVQMFTVPPGMTVLQNPLSLGQMQTVLGQPNGQVYMIPTNQPNIMQAGALAPGLIGQQMLQPGQNVTVMQPNQLTVPNNMQYNTLMPMNMTHNAQYMPGINLTNPLAAQQLNAALTNQTLNPGLAVSNTIPIVQANPPGSPLTNVPQTITVTQPSALHQVLPQNSTYVTPNSLQSGTLPQQYLLQPNTATIPIQSNTTMQYNIQGNQASNPQPNMESASSNQSSTSGETESNSNQSNSNTTNQTSYMTSSAQQAGYTLAATQDVQHHSQPSYTSDSTNNSGYTQNPNNQNGNAQQNYNNASNGTPNSGYNGNNQATPQSGGAYSTNASNTPPANQNSYASNAGANGQNVGQTNYSPSSTPAPQANQSTAYNPNANLATLPNSSAAQAFPPSQQANPYPNATGQNMAAYANNQYAYTNGPWFRPPPHAARFASPQPPYNAGAVAPAASPMPIPAPAPNYNYWQDS